ncbi:extracellular solute-binding protein family 1 [Caldicellulosiruptor hydrothermalis 108]|uniref:Extracellular solute-binding protein family 1 n=1 Tax=Caldicellulosiruptor hydrothermalis (strain DSM 18901 / VKM B-2411 / 108) TaxID=632292 RepID=E4QAJ9_CALH1|nr:extracellular solute-binding protein family 1 [Caldicellulosiruptor hydrothermalis 108]
MTSVKSKKFKVVLSFTLLIVFFIFITLPVSAVSPSFAASSKSSKPVITWWTALDAKVAVSYNNLAQVACYQYLMKKFNVKIEFIHPPSGSETEQFNLMLASKKLPDIIETDWLSYPGGPLKAIADGVIIKLNNYLQKYAPNLKKYLDTHPDIKRDVITDDGTIYCFPFIREGNLTRVGDGPYIRKDWLDKLKLPVPETVNEWTNMLRKFRDNAKILNGRKAPIYPFSIAFRFGSTLRTSWRGSFLAGAWGITLDFYVENGKVKYGPLTSQYKEFIKVLQTWWKENLIDPDILNMNTQAIQAKILNDQIGAYLGRVSGDTGRFLQAKKGTEFDITVAPWPVLKKGQKPEIGHKHFAYPGYGSAAITTQCKNIPLAMKILDWGYSKEGYMVYNFGIKGKSYVIKNGKPMYTDEILNNPKLSILEALSKYARAGWVGPFPQSEDYVVQILPFPQQREALKILSQPSNSKILPPVTLTVEESKKVANILNAINTYYDEMFVRMITGKFTNIDSFQKTLKRMGIDEVLKVYQDAYNRYIKRKI